MPRVAQFEGGRTQGDRGQETVLRKEALSVASSSLVLAFATLGTEARPFRAPTPSSKREPHCRALRRRPAVGARAHVLGV